MKFFLYYLTFEIIGGVVLMVVERDEKRLDKRFISEWKGRENEDCLWWNGSWWSWNRLNDMAKDCEVKLKDAGFAKGQRIAIILPNSPIVIALSIACWKLGGAVAPINARTGLENLKRTLQILDPAAVFVSENNELLAPDAEESRFGVFVAPLDEPLPPFKCVKGIPENEDHAVIFSTSGTSGRPKAVPCTHSNLLANIDPIKKHVPGLLDDDSIILNVLPNFHSFGFNMSGMLSLMSGIRQVVLSSFVPVDNTIEAIKVSGANIIIGVPTIMFFILGALAKRDERLKGMKFVITGGDRLDVKMNSRSKEYLGVGILEGYGLTECSPVVAVGQLADDSQIGTVGKFFDNYEVQIRDGEGKRLDINEEGVLWVKGPCVVSGYFRDDANTRERFEDGWFNTGDVVRIDKDGYVRIVDRATDIIIVSGFNVYPREVENVLCEHPAVQSAAAVGEKNRMTGEIVKAFVLLKEGKKATQKELTDYCKKNLAHYKVPHKIGFLKELPISPAGKVLRRELRKIEIDK